MPPAFRKTPLPGPIGRFAVATLLLFVAVGFALFNVLSTQLRESQEQAAQFHAQFATQTLLEYELKPEDFTTAPSGERLRELETFTRTRVLIYPALRIKVWTADGTVVFSDAPQLIGQRFDNDEVSRAASGQTISEVEDLTAPENVFERGLAPKLFATYVPLRLAGATTGTPDGVVEFYQDYAQIQSATDRMLRILILAITAGLALLYLLLIPLARLTTRTEFERQRAVRQSTEKSRFLAFMSHELRTPLNSILGFAQLLEEPSLGDLSERQTRYVSNIRSSGEHLLALITDILDLSKVEAGAMDFELEPVPLRDLFQEVGSQVAPLARSASLTLTWADPGDLTVAADPIRLKQVLLNLASNAIKFTKPPGRVTVSAAGRAHWIDIAVTDTGIGMSAEQLSQVFKPFVQVDRERTRRSSGTGLGLALSRGLVERMGGRLAATSIAGQGSRFTISLPAAEPASALAAAHAEQRTETEAV